MQHLEGLHTEAYMENTCRCSTQVRKETSTRVQYTGTIVSVFVSYYDDVINIFTGSRYRSNWTSLVRRLLFRGPVLHITKYLISY